MEAAQRPQLDRNLLSKVLGMLGSDADGEAASAGRRATEMLRAAGLTWAELLADPQPQSAPQPALRYRGRLLTPPYGDTWSDAVHHLLSVHRDRLTTLDALVLDGLALRLGNARTAPLMTADDAMRVIRIHASLQPQESRP